jgi:hypothetical protein
MKENGTRRGASRFEELRGRRVEATPAITAKAPGEAAYRPVGRDLSPPTWQARARV